MMLDVLVDKLGPPYKIGLGASHTWWRRNPHSKFPFESLPDCSTIIQLGKRLLVDEANRFWKVRRLLPKLLIFSVAAKKLPGPYSSANLILRRIICLNHPI